MLRREAGTCTMDQDRRAVRRVEEKRVRGEYDRDDALYGGLALLFMAAAAAVGFAAMLGC